MGKCDFSVFKDEIETSAKSKAKKAGRDEGNIEDQIRTAIELLRGLEIQNSPEAVKLQMCIRDRNRRERQCTTVTQ